MNKLTYSFLIINCLFLVACGNKNSTNAQHTAYPIKRSTFYIRYIEIKRELQAEARFTTDSSNFEIPKGVIVNELKLATRKLPEVGIEYRYIKENVAYKPPYIFSYQDAQDKTLNFELNMPRLDSLKVGSKGISLSKGGLIVWKGQALTPEESLTIIITDSKGQNLTFSHIGKTKGAQFELIAGELKPLNLGAATLSISQQKNNMLTDPKTTTAFTTEYYYKEIETEIVK